MTIPHPPDADERRTLQSAVAGRYTIERELGRGGMGVVYLARDLTLERPVALKVLPAAMAAQPELRERFLRETRTAAGLSHPNIVSIHSVEERDGLVFFIMGYVDGETLTERVARVGPLPPADVTRVLQEAAWALSHAHGRGIVHRDVKPDNIMIERGTGRALLTDFGIARVVDSTMTMVGESLGTPQYMSPEQASGESVDARSDIYSLGLVGFFALTGHVPFDAATTQAILAMQVTKPAPPVASARPGVPRRLAQAIDRSLAKNPGERWPTADAFVESLQGDAGAVEIAAPVRNFQRSTEMAAVQAFMILLVALTFAGSDPKAAAILALMFFLVVIVQMVSFATSARALYRRGFTYADLRLAFEVDARQRREEAEAMRAARAPEPVGWRRVAARAGPMLAGAVAIGIGISLTRHSHVHRLTGLFAIALVSLGFSLGFVLPLARRRGIAGVRRPAGIASRLWLSAAGRAFFHIAARGISAPTATPGSIASEDALARTTTAVFAALPPAVRRELRPVRQLIAELQRSAASARAREQDLDRAIAEAEQAPALAGVRSAGGSGDSTAQPLATRRAALGELLRTRRDEAAADYAAVLAAIENLRLHLVLVRTDAAHVADMTPDIESARALAVKVSRSPAAAPPLP